MFKSHVKGIMEAKSATIDGLAANTGLSTRTINRARSDKWIAECRLSTLKRIAAALGVKVTELFEEKD